MFTSTSSTLPAQSTSTRQSPSAHLRPTSTTPDNWRAGRDEIVALAQQIGLTTLANLLRSAGRPTLLESLQKAAHHVLGARDMLRDDDEERRELCGRILRRIREIGAQASALPSDDLYQWRPRDVTHGDYGTGLDTSAINRLAHERNVAYLYRRPELMTELGIETIPERANHQ
jgi:hypothetical protein